MSNTEFAAIVGGAGCILLAVRLWHLASVVVSFRDKLDSAESELKHLRSIDRSFQRETRTLRQELERQTQIAEDVVKQKTEVYRLNHVLGVLRLENDRLKQQLNENLETFGKIQNLVGVVAAHPEPQTSEAQP